jgi:hypothetical protein
MNDPQWEAARRNLVARVAAVTPPDGLEAAVMAEFDRAHRRRPARMFALCGALAASILAGTLLMRPAPKSAAPAESQAFYSIPYTPPLEPYERVMVVQEQVPVTELIAAGFHFPAADPEGTMRADVMVSQDGRPRAIRPVVFNLSDRSNR